MDNKLLWFQISLYEQKTFNEFLELFKSYVRQVKEPIGNNVIYFPTKSFANDYSKIFLSLSEKEYDSFKELLLKRKVIQLKEKPSDEINKVYSDEDAPSFEDEEAKFM